MGMGNMNQGFSVLRGGISDKIKNTVERGPRLLSVRRGERRDGTRFCGSSEGEWGVRNRRTKCSHIDRDRP